MFVSIQRFGCGNKLLPLTFHKWHIGIWASGFGYYLQRTNEYGNGQNQWQIHSHGFVYQAN
jgi:hypothetical protein